jgi:hypothetical protein
MVASFHRSCWRQHLQKSTNSARTRKAFGATRRQKGRFDDDDDDDDGWESTMAASTSSSTSIT